MGIRRRMSPVLNMKAGNSDIFRHAFVTYFGNLSGNLKHGSTLVGSCPYFAISEDLRSD